MYPDEAILSARFLMFLIEVDKESKSLTSAVIGSMRAYKLSSSVIISKVRALDIPWTKTFTPPSGTLISLMIDATVPT